MPFFRRWQRPRALTFDLDDTLYDNRPYIRHANQWLTDALADEVGRRIDWQDYKRQVLQAQPDLIHDVTACRLAWLTLGLKEQRVPHYRLRASELMDAFIFERSNFCVPQSSHLLLAQLAARYPLVAMTNGNVDITRIGLRDYFSHIYVAGKGYRQKPYSDLFDAAAAALELPPCAIAHIGDHPVTDVYGALQNGYQAIWLNDRAQAEPVVLPHLMIYKLNELEDYLL